MTAVDEFTTITAKPTPPPTVLRGPADADHYRVRVGRFNDRWYSDPLPSCPIAEATEAVWPSISTVKKASGQDWSFVSVKRIAMSDELTEIGKLQPAARHERVKTIDKLERDMAFKRGANVHLIAEASLYGQPCPIGPGDPGYNYRAAIDAFFNTYQPELVAAEFVTIHRTLNGVGYGGTSDALIRIDNKLYLVDWKGLAVDTPIPTPAGWTTMGELCVGDIIFGASGMPTRITAKSQTHWNPSYRIVFDDTSTLIADEDHRWKVVAGLAHDPARVVTTSELAAFVAHGVVVRMPLAGPIMTPHVALPIEPYLLGAWLGDGTARDGTITKPSEALWNEIRRRGHPVSPEYSGDKGTHNIYGFARKLEDAGLQQNKHVPDIYLRASIDQRLDLLRGLMDTDGTWNKTRKQAAFETTTKALAVAVQELVRSLGWRCSWFEGPAKGFGVTTWRYRVSFRPFNHSPFLARETPSDLAPFNSRVRYVRNVERIIDVPTQCITVDADDEMYLAGEQFAVTHNSRGEESNHGGYPEEAAQVAGYAQAEYIVIEGANGPERQTIPVVDGGLIVSIKPDGYEIYPVDIPKGFEHWTALHAWWVARRQEREAVGRKWAPRKASTPTDEWVVVPVERPDDPNKQFATVDATPDRRTGLIARYNLFHDDDKRRFLALNIDRDDLDAVEKALDTVDPFLAPYPPAPAPTPLEPQPAPVPPPDEGHAVDDNDFLELSIAYANLDDTAQAWLKALIVAGSEAGVDWRAQHHHTQRRFELYRGLIALAAAGPEWGNNDTVTDIIIESTGFWWPCDTPTGAWLGQLNAKQAVDFAQQVDHYLALPHSA